MDEPEVDVRHMREEVSHTIEGNAHLFCALADALERSGVLKREDLVAAIEDKIHWLGHHNANLNIAVPLLQARDWILKPPVNPADAFGHPGAAHLRPVPDQ